MKFFQLITNGRSGSDFFHSLIDNHNEIASLPGTIDLKDLKKKWYKIKQLNQFISYFIKNNRYLFNSKKNKDENHNKLGLKKNEFFFVDKKKFLQKFLEINQNNTNFELILINIHLSYYLISRNKKINKIKNIFIHVHHFNKLIEFSKYQCEIFYTYRHPISILNSGVQAFFRNKNGNIFTPKTLEFYLSRIIYEPFFIKTKHKVNLIRLEVLHLHSKKFIKKICSLLKVKFNNNLLKSTFMGKLWWGDSFSKQKESAFNKNFKIVVNKENFYNKDFYFIQKILSDEMKKCKYKKINFHKFNFFNIFIPLKIEIMVFFDLIKNYKFFYSILLFFYYIKRVFFYIYYFLFKKNSVKINII